MSKKIYWIIRNCSCFTWHWPTVALKLMLFPPLVFLTFEPGLACHSLTVSVSSLNTCEWRLLKPVACVQRGGRNKLRFINIWRWITEVIVQNCVGARIWFFSLKMFWVCNFSQVFLSYRHTHLLWFQPFLIRLVWSAPQPFMLLHLFLYRPLFSIILSHFSSSCLIDLLGRVAAQSLQLFTCLSQSNLCLASPIFSVLFYTEPSGVTKRHPASTEVCKTYRQR